MVFWLLAMGFSLIGVSIAAYLSWAPAFMMRLPAYCFSRRSMLAVTDRFPDCEATAFARMVAHSRTENIVA